MFSIELHKSLFKKKKLEEPEPHPCALEQHPISPTPKFVVKILNLSRIVEESTNPREKRHFYRNNTSPPNLHSPSFKPYKVTSFLFFVLFKSTSFACSPASRAHRRYRRPRGFWGRTTSGPWSTARTRSRTPRRCSSRCWRSFPRSSRRTRTSPSRRPRVSCWVPGGRGWRRRGT